MTTTEGLLDWLKSLEACVRYGTKLNESDMPLIDAVRKVLSSTLEAPADVMQRVLDAVERLADAAFAHGMHYQGNESCVEQRANRVSALAAVTDALSAFVATPAKAVEAPADVREVADDWQLLPAVHELRKALSCLYLATDAPIAADVQRRAEAAMQTIAAHGTAQRAAGVAVAKAAGYLEGLTMALTIAQQHAGGQAFKRGAALRIAEKIEAAIAAAPDITAIRVRPDDGEGLMSPPT